MVANKFSFAAPEPSYSIRVVDSVETQRSSAYLNVEMTLKNGKTLEEMVKGYPFLEAKAYSILKLGRKLKEKDDNNVVLIEVKNKKEDLMMNNRKNNMVFCHGNATDLGKSLGTIIDLAYQLKCTIYAFDYTGYGQSKGTSTESSIYKDMETVLEFLTEIKPNKIKASSVILLGQSLGSACCVDISKNMRYKSDIKGMILLSPIASGLKIALQHLNLKGFEEKEEIDVFCNESKITDITTPIFIIHGQRDELIDIRDCKKMAQKVKRLKEWYPEEGNHNNIIQKYRFEFFKQVKAFVDVVNESVQDELEGEGMCQPLRDMSFRSEVHLDNEYYKKRKEGKSHTTTEYKGLEYQNHKDKDKEYDEVKEYKDFTVKKNCSVEGNLQQSYIRKVLVDADGQGNPYFVPKGKKSVKDTTQNESSQKNEPVSSSKEFRSDQDSGK